MIRNDAHDSQKRVRALFLSDFHFGYKGVDGAALLDCLRSYSPQKIYLIGDIVDGWKLSKRWHWRADYTRILDALVDHKQRGTKIIYIPGNHDERVRKISPFRRARFALRTGIRICNSCIHRTKDGRRIIVLHGDQFDNVLTRKGMARIGDWIHDFLSDFFGFMQPAPVVMIEGKAKKFSLAKAVQASNKTALQMMNNLERAVVRLIERKKVDGLICGHSHVPLLKNVNDGKAIFGNCGMWMGHTNTCIIETLDGTLELARWPDMRKPGSAEDVCIAASDAVHMARHFETAFTIRKIRQLWPSRLQSKRVVVQTFESQEWLVDHEGRDFAGVIGHTSLGDKIRA